jgi:3-oxoacyl-[acyl-carrier protein] reductase
MKNKSIIIAGGSGGLGRSVCEAIAQRGGIPVIGCRENRVRADELAGIIERNFGTVSPVVAGDIRDPNVRARLIEAANRAGDLYGLVSLVGDPARVPIETATEEDLISSMRNNFTSPVLLARDFAAALGEKDGSIVFISTMQAVGVFPNSTAYAAPKAALQHTARILARQWRIRVNVVAPGVNNAGLAEKSVRSGKYDGFVQNRIIPRLGRPEDVARAILFFLEPDNYTTGQVLTVDGGLILKM